MAKKNADALAVIEAAVLEIGIAVGRHSRIEDL
jgi:hypothetical protein